MFVVRSLVMRALMRLLGASKHYREIVESDRLDGVTSKIRQDLQALLESVNEHNAYFRGRFSAFLAANREVDDQTFLARHAELPVFTKSDYAQAGSDVMSDQSRQMVPSHLLEFDGNPFKTFWRIRSGKFLMPMATGGSTSLPLNVYMTKQHMFSSLFTFFKCWHRMGWRPGDKMLIFYPANTYNMDDLTRFNPFSALSGFRIQLFDRIDAFSVTRLVDELNRFRPKLLLVFPSPMNMVADTIRKLNLPLKHHPELINVSGETFFDCQRKNIQDVFTGSLVEDSYGSVELGEIAHETEQGLEVFANVAYVENSTNEHGKPEMIITRLGISDFPFLRYQMKDIADIEFRTANDQQQFVISNIEGKDSNYILSHASERLYPSFFNRLVNQLNRQVDDEIVEVKVFEKAKRELELQFITRTQQRHDEIRDETLVQLKKLIGDQMQYHIEFVDFIDHDYRRKYRVIQRLGDVEYAGGIVGNETKLAAIASSDASSRPSTKDQTEFVSN